MWKNVLKNERGLTLVELLAVVVILGIIAAIAIPSIGGIIDNSKKDAHVANAQQMINSARLAVAGEPGLQPTMDGFQTYIPLKYLVEEGYIEEFTSPDNGQKYEEGVTFDPNQHANQDPGPPTNGAVPTNPGSYVLVEKGNHNSYNYSVLLRGAVDSRSVAELDTANEPNDPVEEAELGRDKVTEDYEE